MQRSPRLDLVVILNVVEDLAELVPVLVQVLDERPHRLQAREEAREVHAPRQAVAGAFGVGVVHVPPALGPGGCAVTSGEGVRGEEVAVGDVAHAGALGRFDALVSEDLDRGGVARVWGGGGRGGESVKVLRDCATVGVWGCGGVGPWGCEAVGALQGCNRGFGRCCEVMCRRLRGGERGSGREGGSDGCAARRSVHYTVYPGSCVFLGLLLSACDE